MKESNKKQLKVFIVLMAAYALVAGVSVFLPAAALPTAYENLQKPLPLPLPFMALANAALVFVIYGLMGAAGYLLARKLGWPGIYKAGADWKKLFLRPFVIGTAGGIILVVFQKIFIRFHSLGELPHPDFPLSVLASLGAGIGEETMFRLFFLSLWAFILWLIFKKFNKRNLIGWIAVIIAALAFGAAHFPALMFFYGFNSLGQFSAVFIIEILCLNALIAVPAGREFIKYGLVAAAGVHFWADIVWHVIYGLF